MGVPGAVLTAAVGGGLGASKGSIVLVLVVVVLTLGLELKGDAAAATPVAA